MQKKKVDISILSANYNNGLFLKEYFDSIFNSTVWPNEIVLVDDYSQDNSLEIISSYIFKGININLISLEKNMGFPRALNSGIMNVNSKYIMRLDPDDFILPEKIEKQYKFLIDNNDYDIVGTNAFYYNNQQKKVIFHTNLPTSSACINKYISQGKIPVLHSSIMGKTTTFKKFSFNPESYPSEDYDFIAQLIKHNYKIINLKEPLMYYRIHANNLSYNNLKMQINKTHYLKNKYFYTKTSKIDILIKYYHLLYYRKALLAKNIKKYFFLIVSVCLNFNNFIKRILKINC